MFEQWMSIYKKKKKERKKNNFKANVLSWIRRLDYVMEMRYRGYFHHDKHKRRNWIVPSLLLKWLLKWLTLSQSSGVPTGKNKRKDGNRVRNHNRRRQKLCVYVVSIKWQGEIYLQMSKVPEGPSLWEGSICHPICHPHEKSFRYVRI